jgi:hypothetical protein
MSKVRTFKGHEMRVPPLGMGTKVPTPARAVAAVPTPPEGRPDGSWKVSELNLWAEAMGVNFQDSALKAERVEVAQEAFDAINESAPAEPVEVTEEF